MTFNQDFRYQNPNLTMPAGQPQPTAIVVFADMPVGSTGTITLTYRVDFRGGSTPTPSSPSTIWDRWARPPLGRHLMPARA